MLAYAPYVVIVLLIAVAYSRDMMNAIRLHDLIDTQDYERREWTRERAELLNRVQAPHVLPVPSRPASVEQQPGEPSNDDWELIGQILTPAEDEQ